MKFENGDLVIQSCALTTSDAPIHYGIVVNVCSVDKRRSSREVQVHWPTVPYWSEHLWIRMAEHELIKVDQSDARWHIVRRKK